MKRLQTTAERTDNILKKLIEIGDEVDKLALETEKERDLDIIQQIIFLLIDIAQKVCNLGKPF